MKPIFNFKSPETPAATAAEKSAFWVLLFLMISWRCLLALQPLEKLVAYTVPDDMFYYLQCAANFLSGHGVTFDQLSRTNGFHPLYFMLVAALQSLGLKSLLLTRSLLLISAGMGVATACLLSRYVRQISNRFLGLATLVAYGLNPYVVSRDVNGLETSCYGLLLVLTLLQYFSLKKASRISLRAWAGWGVWIGLTILARTEALLLLPALALAAVWQQPLRLNLKTLLPYGVAGATALLVAAPWFGWNLFHFGTILQDSALAIPYYAQQKAIFLLGHAPGWGEQARALFLNLDNNLFMLLSLVLGIPFSVARKFPFFFMALPVALVLAGVLGFRKASAGHRPDSMPDNLPTREFHWLGFSYVIFLFLYYTLVHRYYHWHYFYAQLILLIPFGIVGLGSRLPETLWQNRWRYAGLLGWVLALAISNWLVIIRWQNFPWQPSMVKMAGWMQEHLPPESRIGAFNSGIYGFWSQRQIINLDGVMNHDMLPVLKKKELAGYLDRQKINYLCDFESMLREYLAMFAPGCDFDKLEKVKSFERQAGLENPDPLDLVKWPAPPLHPGQPPASPQ